MANIIGALSQIGRVLRTAPREIAPALRNITTTGIRTGQRAVPGVTQAATTRPGIVRSWAEANGIKVSAKGPVSREITAAYKGSAFPLVSANSPISRVVQNVPPVANVNFNPRLVTEAPTPSSGNYFWDTELSPIRRNVTVTEALPSSPRGDYVLDEMPPPVRPRDSGAGGGVPAVEEAVVAPIEDAATEAIKRSLAARAVKPAALTALTASSFAPALADRAGVDLPEPVRAALNVAGVVGGTIGARYGLGKFRQPGIKNKLLGAAVGVPSAASIVSSLSDLLSGPPAEAVPVAPVPAVPGQVPTFGPQGGAAGAPEQEAVSQMAMIDAAYEQALTQLMAQYGSLENMVMSAQAGDPVLNQQLAQIDAQYTAAQQAVSDSYSAAIGGIEGYAEQADALMREVAAQQAADYAAASGGMETMTAPAGVTGASGALAGASQTALGGGGIMGAALSRAAGGAASAQGAASRLALGTDLTGAAAATRAEQASMLAGLGGQRASAEQQVRIASAQREAEARAAQQQNLTSIRQAQAEATYNLALNRAQQLASMSPQDYAAAQGGGRQQYPEWYGARIPGPLDAPANIAVNVKDSAGKPMTVSATTGQVNSTLDQLDAALATVALDPQNAYSKLAEFYASLEDNIINIYANTGRPITAGEAYIQLFGRAP